MSVPPPGTAGPRHDSNSTAPVPGTSQTPILQRRRPGSLLQGHPASEQWGAGLSVAGGQGHCCQDWLAIWAVARGGGGCSGVARCNGGCGCRETLSHGKWEARSPAQREPKPARDPGVLCSHWGTGLPRCYKEWGRATRPCPLSCGAPLGLCFLFTEPPGPTAELSLQPPEVAWQPQSPCTTEEADAEQRGPLMYTACV